MRTRLSHQVFYPATAPGSKSAVQLGGGRGEQDLLAASLKRVEEEQETLGEQVSPQFLTEQQEQEILNLQQVQQVVDEYDEQEMVGEYDEQQMLDQLVEAMPEQEGDGGYISPDDLAPAVSQLVKATDEQLKIGTCAPGAENRGSKAASERARSATKDP